MVQAGGPAAINGFLYQILNHLAWFADIRISGKIAGHSVAEDVCLVLEPRNGGDARCEGLKTYVVEQYKVRPEGTWSTNSIINDVLSDLRKAVPEPITAQGVYCFVTDGRKGRLGTFTEFLVKLKAYKSPTEIDDGKIFDFGRDLPNTQRKLFQHIVKKTHAGKAECTRANEELTIFKLLQNFEMRFEVAADDRAKDIERFLRSFVPDLGDEVKTRIHLVGELMSRLAQGELCLDPAGVDELLRKVGLNPDRLRKFAVLNATMVPLVSAEATRMKYKRTIDVRQSPPWPEEKYVLVISGRSGDGKTWQLAKTVTDLSQINKVAVLIRAGSTTDETLTRAVRLVWQDGLGETSEKSPKALALHLQDMQSGSINNTLTIGVDDVREVNLVRDLIHQPWQSWGMRLVMTVPHSMVRSLKYEAPEYVHFHDVVKFSIDEVDALLKSHGQSWAKLPLDLQKLLRIPILAGLYVSFGYGAFQSAPNTEYEIFEKFWLRMQAKVHPGDSGVLLALAGQVIDEKLYPLPRPLWGEVGLTDDVFTRLDTVGWLQSNEAGEVVIAHDRLLNWAAAKEVVHRYQAKVLTLEMLTSYLKKCAQPQWSNSTRRLDYLPMDVLWLLLKNPNELEDFVTLLESLEQEQIYGSYASDLYKNLLPTLGIRVVPLLLARLDKLGELDRSDYQAKLIADAMTAVARQESVDLSCEAKNLIQNDSQAHQKVGIALLTVTPVAGTLDHLWMLHLERCERFDNGKSSWFVGDYQASHAALRVGVKQNPEWLSERINKLNSDVAGVYELGYLLSSLDHPLASKIWNEGKGALFTYMPKDRQRSLIQCIGRFNDTSEVEFLIGCLHQAHDSMGGAAFSRLVKIDPDQALQHLGDYSLLNQLVMYRGWWLPDLLHDRPNETRNKLLEIARINPDGRRSIEQLFQGRGNELDKLLLDFILHSFQENLSRNFDVTSQSDPIWITFPLRIFNEISKPDLLTLLVEKSKGELENMLVKLASRRIGRYGRSHDHVLEEIRTFLIILSGSGITELVNTELQSSDYWGRYGGLKWAMIRPDATTLNILGDIARAVVICDSDGKPLSEPMQENYSAMRVLAAAQADDLLVDAIWVSGSPYFSDNLAEMRGLINPMGKAVTKRAADTFALFENEADRQRDCALVTAWVSADKDFIAPIKAALAHIEPSSLTAVYACVALQQFGDDSDEFAKFANKLLISSERKITGINVLFGLGEKSIPYLTRYLDQIKIKEWQDSEVRVLRYLALHEESRAYAVEKAYQCCITVRSSIVLPFDLAVEFTDAEFREKILDDAFSGSSYFREKIYFAIECLAKFDSKRAIEAIMRHLNAPSSLDRELCLLLIQITPDTAATLLFDMAREGERKGFRTTVGRALRRLNPTDIDVILENAFSSTNRRSREVAVELAGWLPIQQLGMQLAALYAIEPESDVRATIFLAQTRRRNEVIVLELFEKFKASTEEQRWVLLLSILQLGDPILLSDSEDILWIGKVLVSFSFKYRHFVNQEIKQRIQELK